MQREVKAEDITQWTPSRIIQWLNAEPHSPAVKRVSRFIQLFNRARELNLSFRLFFESKKDMFEFLSHDNPAAHYVGRKDEFSTGWQFKFPQMQALNDSLNQILAELNKIAKRYKWHPFIRHMGFPIDFEVTETWESRGREQGMETLAIWWFCGRNSRFIDNFRECRECGKWLFALVDHQSYCSDRCRKRHSSHDEEFRERRRLYMRTYRHGEWERDNGAKAAVKKVRIASLSAKRRS
jgi:hypothetical protein